MYEELKTFLTDNNIDFSEKKPASSFTSFRIGGECFTVTPDNVNKLTDTAAFAENNGIKYTLIGAGSNVLFPDEGYDGVVIMTGGVSDIIQAGALNGNVYLLAFCGTPLYSLCRYAYENGLTGLEFAYGIPGSVGGAIYMNAGAYGSEICDVVTSAAAFDPKKNGYKTYNNAECGFAYRESRFMESREIVTSAIFSLKHGNKEEIKAKMDETMQKRKDKQPLNYPSAGSVFKRYPGKYTGQMIDQAGLKGYTIGGAQVSEKHAGFIINKDHATAGDVKALISYIKDVIREKENVELECELRFIE